MEREKAVSAKIHRLFGSSDARAATPHKAPAPAPAAPLHPLVETLRRRYCELLVERLEGMFEGADDLLFGMSRRATNNSEQRLYMDTMRAVRLDRPQIADRFRREIEACFSPGFSVGARPQDQPVDFDKLSLQDNATLELNIAMANMETKASGLFRHSLWEIERRIGWLIRMQNVAMSPHAMSPGGLCGAFRNALEPLSVELEIKLVIFKLFDSQIIGELGWVYGEMLQLFDQHGATPPPGEGSLPGAAMFGGGNPGFTRSTTSAMPAAPGSALGTAQLHNMPKIDPGTLEALRYLSLGAQSAPSARAVYSDAALANDLSQIASGQMMPGVDLTAAWSLLQRAELVGRMFTDILTDPNIPDGVKPVIEELRFPAIKSALHDREFFTDPSHPMRAFVNELSSLAATARSGAGVVPAGLEKLVRQMRDRFDPGSEGLASMARRLEPIAQSDIERFLEDQIKQGQQRRKAILEKARKVVAQELEIALLGHSLPSPALALLNSGWAPMMGVTLLRAGIDSDAWRQGQDLLKRIIRSVDGQIPARQRLFAANGLSGALRDLFTEVGMPEAKSHALICGLESLWPDASTQSSITVADFEAVAGASIDPAAETLHVDDSQAATTASPAEPSNEPADQSLAAAASPGATSASVQMPAESGLSAQEAAISPATAPAVLASFLPPARAETSDSVAVDDAPLMPSVPQLLSLLLASGAWFRIFDRRSAETRWLKVTSYSADAGRVAFAEFDGNNVLVLNTRQLMDDLLTRRSEPIDPTPAAKSALEQYILSQDVGGTLH